MKHIELQPLTVRLGIVLTEFFTLPALAILLDHLREASDRRVPLATRFEWRVMSKQAAQVQSSCGTLMKTHSSLLPPDEFDYVIVAGGNTRAAEAVDRSLLAYVRSAADAMKPIAGICGGSFVLCRARVMGGRIACVGEHEYGAYLERFPQQSLTTNRIFVADGPRLTCTGTAGATALATHLVRKHHSVSRRRTVAVGALSM